MARYPVTKEGAQGLRTLAKDLQSTVTDLSACSSKLSSTISSLNELGDFRGEIEGIVQQVLKAQDAGRDSVEQLSGKVSSLAGKVEAALTL